MARPLYRSFGIALVLAATAAGLACNEDAAGPAADDIAPAAAQIPVGPQVVTGEIGPGALYGLYLPANWNGDLVVYAHGYDTQHALPDYNAALRDGLLSRGFAVAWSSYSQTGMAIEDGVIRTRQVQSLFTSKFTRPEHTYLMGASMGAAVAMELAQTNPQRFDGVLSECGLIGGVRFGVDYFFNVRVLFDYFYPGVIPGTAVEPVPGLNFMGEVAPAITAAILTNPEGAMELAEVDQIAIQYNDRDELIQSIIFPLMFNTADWYTGDIAARAHGQFFDNSDVLYTGSSDDDALNAGVARFTADRNALNALERWYTPAGDLKLPVLTIHTSRDPIVPMQHEALFSGIVASEGASDFLVQRTMDRFGHCAFTTAEELTAVTDLATWVRTGVRPLS